MWLFQILLFVFFASVFWEIISSSSSCCYILRYSLIYKEHMINPLEILLGAYTSNILLHLLRNSFNLFHFLTIKSDNKSTIFKILAASKI